MAVVVPVTMTTGGGRATHKIATMMMVKVTIMALPSYRRPGTRDRRTGAQKRQWRHIRDSLVAALGQLAEDASLTIAGIWN